MLQLDYLSFDVSGLKRVRSTATSCLLADQYGTLFELSLRTPTDFPHDLQHPESLHAYMLQEVRNMGGALIEFHVCRIAGLGAVRLMNKMWHSQDPADLSKVYGGSLIFPLAAGCYFIKAAAREEGTTGIRESTVTLLLHKQGKLKLPAASSQADATDDLGTAIKKSALVVSPADAAEYDADFPSHPLSRVRHALQHIEQSLKVAPELLNTKPYRV